MVNLEKDDFNENLTIEESQESKKRRSFWPVLIFSGLIHSIVILILIFIIVANSKKPADDIIITTQITAVEDEEIKPEEKRDVIKHNVDVTVETELQVQPMVTTEETTDQAETDNNMEVATSEGTSEGISDSPQVGSGLMGNIGGGGGGGGTFGTRSGGGKKKAIMKGGGSAKTESSVDAALRWLMRHQEKDGHWDSVKYGNQHFGQYGQDTAISGLSALAFLSAGHTPKIGKYKNTVKLAIDWILSKQNADGSFGNNFEHMIYDNSICTLALAETYGMYPDPKIKAAAQKAIDYLNNVTAAQVHYGISKEGAPNSTSVLGWVMMAYKSAKIAGLKIPDDAFAKFKSRLDEMTTKDQSGNPERVKYLDPKAGATTTAMTAVGMLVYEYLGVKRTELDVMADNLIKELPGGEFDLYRWYYATLAMFQFGGEKWKKWNKALIETLVGTQEKGGPLDGSLKDVDGSWDPKQDKWGAMGRVYTTAMGAFCLEVYYRYESVVH